MSESVADDPKLAPRWTLGRTRSRQAKWKRATSAPRGGGARTGTRSSRDLVGARRAGRRGMIARSRSGPSGQRRHRCPGSRCSRSTSTPARWPSYAVTSRSRRTTLPRVRSWAVSSRGSTARCSMRPGSSGIRGRAIEAARRAASKLEIVNWTQGDLVGWDEVASVREDIYVLDDRPRTALELYCVAPDCAAAKPSSGSRMALRATRGPSAASAWPGRGPRRSSSRTTATVRCWSDSGERSSTGTRTIASASRSGPPSCKCSDPRSLLCGVARSAALRAWARRRSAAISRAGVAPARSTRSAAVPPEE